MKIGIVGNNVAGIMTAKKLRELNSDVEITIFTQEPFHYYPRPQLIEFLSGDVSKDDLFFYKEDWYQNNKINVHLSTKIEKMDTQSKTLFSASQSYQFDKIVLANGAYSFVPPIKGASLSNVFSLRTLSDAEQIKSKTLNSAHIVIIGGGVLGLETANALQKLNSNAQITVLELAPYLLPRQIDKQGASVVEAILKNNHIHVKTGVKINAIIGQNEVEKVLLESENLLADMVVVSAGVRSYIDLPKQAGLNVNRGILVNEFLETSSKDIYALGDSAEYNGMVYGIIKPIFDMVPVVAENIIRGNKKQFRGYTMSKTVKILNFYVTSVGEINLEQNNDFEIIRVDAKEQYKKYVLKNNILKGFISIGPKIKDFKIKKMIDDGRDVGDVKNNFYNIDFVLE